MRLLADVNVSPRVVALLRQGGLQVTRVSEVLDPRAADEEVMRKALELGAAVVSQDQDHSALLAISGATRPS
jgi:predicted nuclease of predicted toxin-antitoxin system